MRRLIWLMPCALLACKTEPAAPDPTKELQKLEQIERRLQQLEKDWENKMPEPAESTPDEPPPQLGKMAVNVLEEAPPESDRTMSIEVTNTGYKVDGETLDREAIAQRIETWATEHADASLVVRAEAGVEHAKVVALMDIAEDRGVKRLAIAKPAAGG